LWRIDCSDRQRSIAAASTCATDWRKSASSSVNSRARFMFPLMTPYGWRGPGIATLSPLTIPSSIIRGCGAKRVSVRRSSTITGPSAVSV
jgi:hypothetical protein